MSDREHHPIRNGIIATVVGGVILSIITPTRQLIIKLATWLWSGVEWILEAITASYSIPGWVLIISSFFALVGLYGIYLAIRSTQEPEYKKYTEDLIFGAKWRWSWVGNHISDLWCFCPTCDAQLVYDDRLCRDILSKICRTDFICENCGNKLISTVDGGNKNYSVSAAEREILRRIRRNEHK